MSGTNQRDTRPGAGRTEEDPEKVWLRDVYRPHEAQLTARAVVSGMLIGAVMCLSNLYVFLKTGWSMGVTLTACILAFAIFAGLKKIGASKREFGILENNAMSSVASAAGYMTGGGNMAALGAFVMLVGVIPGTLPLVAWFAVIATMGVFAAIPIKRQLINQERLAFPTGMATAETLRSMHEASGGGGQEKARYLGLAGIIGAGVAFLRDAKASWMPVNLPHSIPFPFLRLGGHELSKWTLSIEGSLVLIGAGALMSFRTCWSLLLGGLLTYGWLAPALVDAGVITTISYKTIVTWTLWPGAAILVSSGVATFLFDYKSVTRTFTGLFSLFHKKGRQTDEGVAAVEAPDWWFPAAFGLLTPVIILLMSTLFRIPVWLAIFTVPLGVVMGFVAARVTGETDVTPTKALGPVTQLIYGVAAPGNVTANIMGANVTGGIGLHAADLLTDLKSGYLLGARPRPQLVGQLFGVLAGALVVVPAFRLLVPEASVLGTEHLPAPSCVVWAGVSKALAGGLSGLAPGASSAVVVGLLLGTLLAVVEKLAPRRLLRFIPSASGLGIAMVVPGFNAISMFVGGAIAEGLRRRSPALAERTVIPVSSGFIAGESLMGVLVAALTVAGLLQR